MAFSSFSSLPAAAIPFAPANLAICIAAVPTPPPAAVIRTVSPTDKCATSIRASQAVANGICPATAFVKDNESGILIK